MVKRRSPKYYTHNKKWDTYQVKKRKGKEWVYYGYCKKETNAQLVVEELKKVNWDYDELPINIKLLLSNNSKNYSLISDINQFIIYRKIDNDRFDFGYTSSEDEAKLVVEELRKVDWVYDELSEDIKKLLESDYEPKNYCYIKRDDRYVVYKFIDGKLRNFGRYKYEEDAKLVSDELKKIDWDYNNLPEEYKKLRCVR